MRVVIHTRSGMFEGDLLTEAHPRFQDAVVQARLDRFLMLSNGYFLPENGTVRYAARLVVLVADIESRIELDATWEAARQADAAASLIAWEKAVQEEALVKGRLGGARGGR